MVFLLARLNLKKLTLNSKILNPDGSEAEKSGNGLRIFARYLIDAGKVTTKPFKVDTLGGVVICQVSSDKSIITVDMGKVSFHSDIIPVNISGSPRNICNEEIEVNTKNLLITMQQQLEIRTVLFQLIK